MVGKFARPLCPPSAPRQADLPSLRLATAGARCFDDALPVARMRRSEIRERPFPSLNAWIGCSRIALLSMRATGVKFSAWRMATAHDHGAQGGQIGARRCPPAPRQANLSTLRRKNIFHPAEASEQKETGQRGRRDLNSRPRQVPRTSRRQLQAGALGSERVANRYGTLKGQERVSVFISSTCHA